MTKSKAIAKYCLECSGDSHKEVTLCSLFDCYLWPYRFGYSIKSKAFKRRMKRAKVNYTDEIEEIRELYKDDPGFITNIGDNAIKSVVRALLFSNGK